MLAKELRTLSKESQDHLDERMSQNLVDHMLILAQRAAQQGKVVVEIRLSKNCPWSKQDAKNAAAKLTVQGFQCVVDNKITAMYSNTDWDSEDYFMISW